nr:oligoendopeptidase F [Lachnospiraceae bacterium]
MFEQLKERKDMDPAFMWDLTKMYESDEAWEKAFAQVDPVIARTASFAGKLTDAENILAFFEASTELERVLDNVFSYASLRRSEDTRDTRAQSMYARAYGKYVEASSATAF